MTRFAYQTKSLDPVEAHDNDNHVDVDDAIAALTTTTTAALSKSATDYKNLSDQLAKLESKMGRPGANGPGAANNNKVGDLAAEHKAFANMLRTGNDAEIKAMS